MEKQKRRATTEKRVGHKTRGGSLASSACIGRRFHQERKICNDDVNVQRSIGVQCTEKQRNIKSESEPKEREREKERPET